MLSDLQRDHAADALQVIGIALEDPQLAQAFASDLALGYPLLFGLADAMLVGRRYGNRSGMLPYSVLIDARGIVRWTHLGIVDRDDLEARLSELR
jgi:peroxiredoxin